MAMNSECGEPLKPATEEAGASNSEESPSWVIQAATINNLDELVALEEACFSDPWSRKSFEAELGGNQFSRVLLISDFNGEMKTQAIGYICVWLVFEEIRFMNLAVHPKFRRQGLAKQLICKALTLGLEADCYRGMLEVRQTNSGARNLYESFNFKTYGIRKSYYTNPTEDAILMSLEPLAARLKKDECGRVFGSQESIHSIS